MLSDYINHRRACRWKQAQRAELMKELAGRLDPISQADRDTVAKPIKQLVEEVHKDGTLALDILKTYSKIAVKAHEKTNCVTEVMVNAAEEWTRNGQINLQGPLAGIPVSLKDTICVQGFDTTVGYSKNVGNANPNKDGAVVALLKRAGAIPYVKTNIPITLLSFESANDVWGRSTNPYNAKYTPGGSTGGEAALLAMGGRIGIGSDVAGSVRVPAHFSGIYSIKCSTGRWPKMDFCTSTPGQEGVPSVYSPMARTLDDLVYFTRSVVEMKPWEVDYSCHPMPWKSETEEHFRTKKTLKIGVMRTDGVVDPSPACARALDSAVEAMRRAGHEIIELVGPAAPPSPYEGLRLASQLLANDGLGTAMSFFRWGEWNDRGAAQMRFYMLLPRPIKYLHYLWVRYVRRDAAWAGLLRDWHTKSTFELWALTSKREAYKRQWFDWWSSQGLDFILAPPNATPAVPHEGMNDAVSSCGYTFIFNLLDYSAGVLPVTHVDRSKDGLPKGFDSRQLNGVAQGAYKLYNADAMHGLPVGVQVIGRRLEEEKVLACMERVEEALGSDRFRPLDID